MVTVLAGLQTNFGTCHVMVTIVSIHKCSMLQTASMVMNQQLHCVLTCRLSCRA